DSATVRPACRRGPAGHWARMAPGRPRGGHPHNGNVFGAGWKSPPAVGVARPGGSSARARERPAGIPGRGQQIRSNPGADGHSPDERRRVARPRGPCVRSLPRALPALRETVMFTGLIEGVGTLVSREPRGGDAPLRVAVTGGCLSVVGSDDAHFEADASNETLSLTTLGALAPGRALNLERAMRPGDRLGGHLVSGHVDGVGAVASVEDDGRAQRWRF